MVKDTTLAEIMDRNPRSRGCPIYYYEHSSNIVYYVPCVCEIPRLLLAFLHQGTYVKGQMYVRSVELGLQRIETGVSN